MWTLALMLAEQNVQSAEMDAAFMWSLVAPDLLVGDARFVLMTFSSTVDRLKLVRRQVADADALPPCRRHSAVSLQLSVTDGLAPASDRPPPDTPPSVSS